MSASLVGKTFCNFSQKPRLFETRVHQPLCLACTTKTSGGTDMMKPMKLGGNRSDILVDYSPMFRIYKDGKLERLQVPAPVQPSLDPRTGVESKDMKIFLGTDQTNVDEDTSIFVRIFKPNLSQNPKKKIPIMVYFHGGAFCTDSTFSPIYHRYLNKLASQAGIMIVSVEYRLAPEHPLPTQYDDCWLALNWVANHYKSNTICFRTTIGTNNSSNTEGWLLEHADFSRIFLAGDSSGANIAHQMAMRVGLNGLAGGLIPRISGIILFHPFFWGKARIGDEVSKCSRLWAPDIVDKTWEFLNPRSSGSDDPRFNPANDPTLSRLGCARVLIFVSGKDFLRDRGVYYKEALEKSGWQGKAEVVEYKGENHVFHLFKPSSASSLDVMSNVVAFINQPAAVGIDVLERLSLNTLELA